MNECITDNRFEIIARAKQALLDSTNIDTSPDEMACLNSFLFRCWQMGWLDKYEKDLVEVVRCKDCEYYRDSFGETYCDMTRGHVEVTDYCSYGERKEK